MPRQGPAFACSRAAGEISCLRSGVAPLLSVLGIAPTRLVGLHEQSRAPVERHPLGISDLLFCFLGVALHDWVLALSEQLGAFYRITRAFFGRWWTLVYMVLAETEGFEPSIRLESV
jgi:hypothetical protein